VELELSPVADDRVAGVVAALKAHDEVRPLGEQVGQLALSLVAPLGADDDYSRHDRVIMRYGPAASGGARSGALRRRD
jgi:hypothetical protein